MPLSFIFKAVLKLMLPLSPAPKQHYEAAERESPKDLRDPDPGSLHPLFIRCSRPEAVGFGDTNSVMRKRSVYGISPHHKACMMQPHFLPADNDVALLNISGCGLLSAFSRGNAVVRFCCLTVV